MGCSFSASSVSRLQNGKKKQKNNINISVIQTVAGELVSCLEPQRKKRGEKAARVSVPAMTMGNGVSKHCQLIYLAAH